MKKLIMISLAILLVVSSTAGCSSRVKNAYIGFDIEKDASNLDPQFATDDTGKMVIMSVFEGLVTSDSKGAIAPGVAKSWSISEDQLSYTFKLREDAFWHSEDEKDKASVVAEDFKFGLSRLFTTGAPSPYAQDYSCIQNAKAILAGEVDVSELGIHASEDYQLTIQLEEKDDLFLDKLALVGAMPCNKEFFQETKGRYGLEKSLVRGNGPLYLSRWERDYRLTLTKNNSYVGENIVDISSVDLFVGRNQATERFLDEKTHIVFLNSRDVEAFTKAGYKIGEYESTVWAVAVNGKAKLWGLTPISESLAYFMEKEPADEILIKQNSEAAIGETFLPTNSIFTEENRLSITSISALKENQFIMEHNVGTGKVLVQKTLDMVEESVLPDIVLHYPQGSIHQDYLGVLVKQWNQQYKEFSGQISLNGVPAGNYDEFIAAGEYDMALVPIKTMDNSANGALEQFKSGGFTKYNNPLFDMIVEQGNKSNSFDDKANKYISAERLLLADGGVIPLYIEKGYYAVSKDAENVDVYAVEQIARFHPSGYAER